MSGLSSRLRRARCWTEMGFGCFGVELTCDGNGPGGEVFVLLLSKAMVKRPYKWVRKARIFLTTLLYKYNGKDNLWSDL